eukprot:6993121-Pyramimonas_sp.AAC.1
MAPRRPNIAPRRLKRQPRQPERAPRGSPGCLQDARMMRSQCVYIVLALSIYTASDGARQGKRPTILESKTSTLIVITPMRDAV